MSNGEGGRGRSRGGTVEELAVERQWHRDDKQGYVYLQHVIYMYILAGSFQ